VKKLYAFIIAGVGCGLLLSAAVHAGLININGSVVPYVDPDPPVGDLVNGQPASITGTGFGAVASPTLIYDDFSTGTLNALVRSTPASFTGTWETGAGDDQVFRSNAVSRGVHTRTAYHNLTAATGSYVAALCMNETFTGNWYIDWWQRETPVAPATASWTRNHKLWRFYDNTGWGENSTLTWIAPGQDIQTQFYTWLGTPYISLPLTAGQWRHHRFRVLVAGSYAGDQWVFSSAVNGGAFSEVYNGGWRDAAHNDRYPVELRIGDYWALDDGGSGYGDNNGAQIYTSSVYIANTWARVELCNNVNYAAATICEIQPTSVRTDTGITYQVNQGLLSSGTVYEYVFNASDSQVKSTARTMQ
jgi:hypothetical protein